MFFLPTTTLLASVMLNAVTSFAPNLPEPPELSELPTPVRRQAPVIPIIPTVPSDPPWPSAPRPDVGVIGNITYHAPMWPYYGRYQGMPGSSCGETLDEDGTDAPLLEDCYAAAVTWQTSQPYPGEDGPSARQVNTCVAVWHTDMMGEGWVIDGDDVAHNFFKLFAACAVGNYRYVSKYAFFSVPYQGTYTVYGRDDPADYGEYAIFVIEDDTEDASVGIDTEQDEFVDTEDFFDPGRYPNSENIDSGEGEVDIDQR